MSIQAMKKTDFQLGKKLFKRSKRPQRPQIGSIVTIGKRFLHSNNMNRRMDAAVNRAIDDSVRYTSWVNGLNP